MRRQRFCLQRRWDRMPVTTQDRNEKPSKKQRRCEKGTYPEGEDEKVESSGRVGTCVILKRQ